MSPRTTPVAGGAASSTTRFDTDAGTPVFLEESHALPLVSISVALRTGTTFDPPGKEGTARLAARMLRRGCEGLLAHQIEDAIDSLGGEFSIDVSASSVSFHMQVIERSLDPFVDLVARVLATPSFPEDELARLQRETVAELVEARDSDRSLANSFFRRTLFKGHPYGRRSSGTVASVNAVTVADIRAYCEQHLTQANAVVGISGDIKGARAREVTARLLAKLPVGVRREDPLPAPTPLAGRRLVFVDKPERTQSQILIGGLGTAPDDDDHVPLGVANAVFGGTFTSRLMREVRSKRGWSYGASARLGVDRKRQSFSMWTFPAATDAAACIKLEIELLEAFLEGGITPRETAFIKRYLVRSHAFEIDTAVKRLHQALDVEVLGMPADYYSGYVAKVQQVTRDAANEAARRRISKDDLLVVVVGTASELADAVKAAIPGLGPVDVVPFDQE